MEPKQFFDDFKQVAENIADKFYRKYWWLASQDEVRQMALCGLWEVAVKGGWEAKHEHQILKYLKMRLRHYCWDNFIEERGVKRDRRTHRNSEYCAKELSLDVVLESEDIILETESVVEKIYKQELRDAFERILQTLDGRDFDLVMLLKTGRPKQDIAIQIGVNPSRVSQLLCRIRRQLAKRIHTGLSISTKRLSL